MHKDTPHRWGTPTKQQTPASKLSSVALAKLADIARATSDAVPVSAPVHRQIFQEQLREMGIEYDLPFHWVQEFLRSLGLTWGKSSGNMKKPEDLLVESIDEARGNFCLRLQKVSRGGVEGV